MAKSNLFVLSISALGLSMAGCGGDKAGDDGTPTGGGITATDGPGDDDDDDDDDDGSGEGNQDGDDDDDDDDGPQTYFDVGAGGDLFCKFKDAGVYCNDDNWAIECGDMGNVVSDQNCVPGACLENTGCVTCLQGQYTCSGPHVMQCTAANAWQIQETCDPAAGMGCDLSQPMPTCASLVPLGTTEPTGVYYQYAFFTSTDGIYQGGYDVDSLDNRLYVNHGVEIDVYEVELLDSDGDGVFEPNQHPNNPDETGPIEERVLTYIETIPWPSSKGQSVSELYIGENGIWFGGSILEEMTLPGMMVSTFQTPPGWASTFAQIGYDDVNQTWYASNEQQRRVFQHDAATDQWGLAFYYPSLAGDHMDGLEVVTQPETGIPYVYVSDMTSDFIGQYRLDPNLGWIQVNLFEYEGSAGSLVEGMGFGALNHFWATGSDGAGGIAVYEVGGGDLAEFTEPPG